MLMPRNQLSQQHRHPAMILSRPFVATVAAAAVVVVAAAAVVLLPTKFDSENCKHADQD